MNTCKVVDGVCVQCGEVVAAYRVRQCPAGPNRLRPCVWLGQPTADVGLMECTGCCGRVRLKLVLYDCALFGRCLPHGGGEATHQCCRGCPKKTTYNVE